MTTTRVGPVLLVAAMLSLALPVDSAPHQDLHHDDIGDDHTKSWDVIVGFLEYVHSADEGPSHTYGGSDPTWYRIDANGTAGALVLRDPSAPDVQGRDSVNESLESYMVRLEMARNQTEGHIGVVFGANATGAHYAVTFDDDELALRAPSGASGSTIVDTVPYSGSPAFTALAGVDQVHRYTVKVDAREIRVEVDGFPIHVWDLDEVDPLLPAPVGTFGVRAGENATVFVQRLDYLPLDEAAPTVLVQRPEPGRLYVFDQNPADLPWVADPSVAGVIGDITVHADVADDVLGIQSLRVRIDGQLAPEFSRSDVDDGRHAFTIDTSELGSGYHTIEIVVRDYAGNTNAASPESFEIFVIPTPVSTSPVSTVLSGLAA